MSGRKNRLIQTSHRTAPADVLSLYKRRHAAAHAQRHPYQALFRHELEDIFGDDGSLEGVFDFITKPVEAIGKAIGGAAKWTAGAVGTVLDSTPFKIIFPVTLIKDNPIAKAIGSNIPIVAQAYEAEAKAKGLLKKIASGKNVSKDLLAAGKQAVAESNVLSIKAKQAIAATPAGQAALKGKPVKAGLSTLKSNLPSAINKALAAKKASGVAPRAKAKPARVTSASTPLVYSSDKKNLSPQLLAVAKTLKNLNLTASGNLVSQLQTIAAKMN